MRQSSVWTPYDSSLAWQSNTSNKAIAKTPFVKVSSHRTKSLLSSHPSGTPMPRRMSTGCSSELYTGFNAAPNIGMIRFVRYFTRSASIKTHTTPVSSAAISSILRTFYTLHHHPLLLPLVFMSTILSTFRRNLQSKPNSNAFLTAYQLSPVTVEK